MVPVIVITYKFEQHENKYIFHISGPIQRRFYRKDKHCHFMNLLIIVDNDGFITFCKGGYMGHLVDATCFNYARIPRLPAGLFLLGDSGFPLTDQLIVPARRGQLPGHIRSHVNRYTCVYLFMHMAFKYYVLI